MNPAKTELLWPTGRLQTQHVMGSQAPALQLGSDRPNVTNSDHVRVLGVTFLSDLSLEKHVSNAFVTFRVDYCNAVYAGAPKTVTDKLQQSLNAAARVVSDTRKFDRGLTSLLHMMSFIGWMCQIGLLTRWVS